MGVLSIFANVTFVLAICMIITGSINTISAAQANRERAYGHDERLGNHLFNHPIFQAVGMFLGEMLCLAAFGALRYRDQSRGTAAPLKKFPVLVFLPPALCDMTATSLMYIGLTLTYPSVFQMLRGSVIIFTGILSVLFLKRKLWAFEWLGMGLVTVGLAIVGLASVLEKSSGTQYSNPLLGDALVVIAQVIASVQMVIEEKFVGKHDVPALLAVGLEGVFGFSILSLLLIPMYHIPPVDNSTNRFEDALDAFSQLGRNWMIAFCLSLNVCSIAFFNFFGISITKRISATTRMVLDSVRTLVVWGWSLALGWEDYSNLQVLGFVVQMLGTFIYNELLIVSFLPVRAKIAQQPAGAEERLLAPGDREQEFDGPETSMGTGDDGASLDPAAPSQVQYSRLAFHENGNNTPVHRAEL